MTGDFEKGNADLFRLVEAVCMKRSLENLMTDRF